ncbi:MAG: FtsX-like permease family protein [bacterium]|nr:MAG: FtsX-like permease family protein [bacterium]
MLTIRLAFRNIMGAGLRTWLNIIVLALVLVMIIWVQGLIDGMREYMITAEINANLGGGQFWHRDYDPYDPLSYEESHAPPSPALQELITRGEATPILVAPAAIYPEGRMQSALLKGIDPTQEIISIPGRVLEAQDGDAIPALIGAQMAKQTKLGVGDYVTVRWRDANGTFDADDVRIVEIMHTPVPSIDVGQIWIPIERLRIMLQTPGEASLLLLRKGIPEIPEGGDAWVHRSLDYLLKDILEIIRFRLVTSRIIYGLLLFMGLLAIFDTQVLSVWRRRKEIGTLMALGMERDRVTGLFTFEGALHGILAVALGTVIGIPVLYYTFATGLPVPEMMSDFGVAIPQRLYPSYGIPLIVGTALVVLVSVTVVSFLPVSRITKLKPTDALRGGRS